MRGLGDRVAEMGVKSQNSVVRKQSWLGALLSALDGFHFVTQDFVFAILGVDFVDEDKDFSLAYGD